MSAPVRSMDAPWSGDVPPAATALSEAFEGCVLKPYLDGYGFWTLGIGSRTDPAGRAVTARTAQITRAQAEAMAARDLAKAARLVKAAVRVPITERQAAALILLANNLGDLNAAAASLVALVNAGLWRAAAERLAIYRNSGGKPSTGLRRRRWTEAAFSLGLDAAEAKRRAWAEITTPDGWPKLPGLA